MKLEKSIYNRGDLLYWNDFWNSTCGIGLFIGIIQAATSINEQTLSFVPKLVVVLLTFGLLANLMMVQLTDYFHFIFEQVTQVG